MITDSHGIPIMPVPPTPPSGVPVRTDRTIRLGATLWILGVVEFVIGMGVTQYGWDLLRTGATPVYSLQFNYISDLGAVNCGPFAGVVVCSPWHDVFNASIILLGILLILGTLAIARSIPAGPSRGLGVLLLVIAGIGAIGVGSFPEDVHRQAHALSALLAFALGNLGAIAVGYGYFTRDRRAGWLAYSALSGLVGLAALALFIAHIYGPPGVGGMERLIVAPLFLWAVVEGIRLLRLPKFAPAGIHPSAGAPHS
ncbi:membrane protein containing DUF998 [mine drainage metagenome]|uniref:Membrane protein containing DUF998 n=1 Tax=mine drainage metagenome TaxID=410659 RepID=T1D919_9ZZZZ